MTRLKIIVNPDACIAAGACVSVAPKVFRINPDTNKSEVIDIEAADEATAIEAAQGCPTKAITVIDEETGEQLFP